MGFKFFIDLARADLAEVVIRCEVMENSIESSSECLFNGFLFKRVMVIFLVNPMKHRLLV